MNGWGGLVLEMRQFPRRRPFNLDGITLYSHLNKIWRFIDEVGVRSLDCEQTNTQIFSNREIVLNLECLPIKKHVLTIW